jgi:cytosine/adenosine deaminase-related metal-dependent hydrolase
MAQPYLQADVPSDADYFNLCAELSDAYHDANQHTVHIQVSPAGGQWCSDDLIAKAVEFAQQHQTRVQMHMLETRYQRQYAYRQWGKSFVQHLDEIGALGPWLTLAHMVWVDEADLPLLAERGVGIAHNPSSNLRLRSGIAPVAKMKQAGITVGIGLDGHGLDDDQDYLREMRLAWILSNQPGAGASAPTIPAQTILGMGTLGGAAITLGSNVPLGKLEVGYLADIALVDWHAAQGLWQPDLTYVPDLLLHRTTRQHVAHVMINGQWVVQNGQSTTLDANTIGTAIQDELSRQDDSQREKMARAAQTLAPYLRRFYAQWD